MKRARRRELIAIARPAALAAIKQLPLPRTYRQIAVAGIRAADKALPPRLGERTFRSILRAIYPCDHDYGYRVWCREIGRFIDELEAAHRPTDARSRRMEALARYEEQLRQRHGFVAIPGLIPTPPGAS